MPQPVPLANLHVHTVVNRLTVEMLEQHLEDTRRRHEDGAPQLHERRWEGMGTGMGARRQGPTDPPRAAWRTALRAVMVHLTSA